jgi:hypothetical protein
MTYPAFPFAFFLALKQVFGRGLIRIFQCEECRLLMIFRHKDDLGVISSEIHQILWLFRRILSLLRNDLYLSGLYLLGRCDFGRCNVWQSDLLDFLHQVEEILS